MYLVNVGNLKIEVASNKYDEIKNKIIESEICKEYDVDANLETNTITAELEDVYGDLEMPLDNLATYCKENGHKMSCSISYYGDYEGMYECTDNNFKVINGDDLVIRNASNEILLSELRKRGLIVFVGEHESGSSENTEERV